MQLSLKSRIHLQFAALIAGAGLCMTAVFAALSGAQITSHIHSDSEAAKHLLSNQISERSAELKSQISLVSELQALRGLVINKVDKATVDDWATEYVKKTSADDLVLTGSDGKVLGEGSRFKNHFAAKDLTGVNEALSGKVWTGVIAHSPSPMLGVTVPVSNSGYIIGTITAFQAIDSRTASDLRSILGTHVLFVSNKHVVGSSLDFATRFEDLPIDERRMTINGVEYIARYAPLPHTSIVQGLGFVTLQRYDDVVGPYRKLNIAFFCLLVGALVLTGLVSRGIANTITQPLNQVIAAARKLKEGIWPDRMPILRQDEIGFLQNVFNDMIETLKESQDRLLAMIDLDPLTNLYNHTKFLDKLDNEVKQSTVKHEDLSLLLIDLDNFSKYNEASGHAAGDQVLNAVGEILQGFAPECAVLARYGGEEFAVVLPERGIEESLGVAEALRLKIKDAFIEDGITVSIGCVQFDRDKHTSSGFMLSAELALSVAKQLGKDQVSSSVEQPDSPLQINNLASGDLATIQALAAAVDAKDSYTKGHSERVAMYAYDLAKYVGVSEEEALLIHRTGTLHDVGKIGVPDAILKKPGRLTREEEAVMQTHPALGEVIVRKVPQLADTLPGVRHHHERWDGAGYPDRLKGEEIPRVARFLAIADTFDAMTSDRPYRKGLPAEVAIDEIERNAGKQFEPEIALAFGRLMRRKIKRTA